MDLKENVLYLTRFCGVEQYPVKMATWRIIDGDGTEDDPDMLCLEVSFCKGNDLHEDTASLEAKPIWTIDFFKSQSLTNLLQPGLFLEQPNENEDVEGNLYYVEHQPTTDNTMEILAVDGDYLKIQLTGLTCDVNYYDGSKPKNLMQLVAYFKKD